MRNKKKRLNTSHSKLGPHHRVDVIRCCGRDFTTNRQNEIQWRNEETALRDEQNKWCARRSLRMWCAEETADRVAEALGRRPGIFVTFPSVHSAVFYVARARMRKQPPTPYTLGRRETLRRGREHPAPRETTLDARVRAPSPRPGRANTKPTATRTRKH